MPHPYHLVKRERFIGGSSGDRFVARCRRWPLSSPWNREPELLQAEPDKTWFEAGDIGAPPSHIEYDSFDSAASRVCSMEGADAISDDLPASIEWLVSTNEPIFRLTQLEKPAEVRKAELMTIGA